MVPEQAKQQLTKGKRRQQQTGSSNSDGEGDIFVFEANEAWKDFHSSLLHFFEAGELCDVTLKVILSHISIFALCVALLDLSWQTEFLKQV